MTTPLQSPEIQAFATGFPVTLLHAGVTVTILVAAAGCWWVWPYRWPSP
jgi:putative membrane protein